MIQDIVVFLLIGIALSQVGVQLYRMFSHPKKPKMICGGCDGCEMKKSLVKHART